MSDALDESAKLKDFMLENFDFSGLKKAGVFPKEMKRNDYAGQAKVICYIFSLESVYDYVKIGEETPVHISYSKPAKKGEHIEEYRPFVQMVGGQKKDVNIAVVPLNKNRPDEKQ